MTKSDSKDVDKQNQEAAKRQAEEAAKRQAEEAAKKQTVKSGGERPPRDWPLTTALWANLATALGTLVAVVSLVLSVCDSRDAARDASEQAHRQTQFIIYNELSRDYVAFERLCGTKHVDCMDDVSDGGALFDVDSDASYRDQLTVFAELTSLLERAYIFFNKTDPEPARKSEQWPGWCGYAASMVARPQFCRSWTVIRLGFDKDFMKWIEDDLAACRDGETAQLDLKRGCVCGLEKPENCSKDAGAGH